MTDGRRATRVSGDCFHAAAIRSAAVSWQSLTFTAQSARDLCVSANLSNAKKSATYGDCVKSSSRVGAP
jgi:hypothetical protein